MIPLRTPAALLTADAVRARCEQLYALAEADALEHFALDPAGLDAVAERVVRVTRAAYPTLEIPYHSRWQHFDVGGVPRIAELDAALAHLEPAEQARSRIDLVVLSVLLDAGAGPRWSYREQGKSFGRSEGLAVASLRMFLAARVGSEPLRVDAAGLKALGPGGLVEAFQVSEHNPLVGLDGRWSLLASLAARLRAAPELFGEDARPGGLYDAAVAKAEGGKLEAADLLGLVLAGLGPIWPGRYELDGVNLGDVWPHPALEGEHPADALVPFHKLSQWLTYSLLEPLEWAGLEVVGLDRLTGLPEYRNGGLLLDLGALRPKHAAVTGEAHAPGEPVIVEWRALTVALLDRVAPKVRAALGLEAAAFPLAKVLQGGTWAAGRELAAELRDGQPPIQLLSDGTVF